MEKTIKRHTENIARVQERIDAHNKNKYDKLNAFVDMHDVKTVNQELYSIMNVVSKGDLDDETKTDLCKKAFAVREELPNIKLQKGKNTFVVDELRLIDDIKKLHTAVWFETNKEGKIDIQPAIDACFVHGVPDMAKLGYLHEAVGLGKFDEWVRQNAPQSKNMDMLSVVKQATSQAIPNETKDDQSLDGLSSDVKSLVLLGVMTKKDAIGLKKTADYLKDSKE